jgi:sugar phosphate isomerase/epimerase
VELCSAFFPSQDARYLNDLRRAIEGHGLTVRNIAVDMGNIAGADPAVRRTDLEALKGWFYTASALRSAAIRVNTGHADDPGAMDRVIEGYRELVKVGEQAGVRLLIENHGGVSSTSPNLARILAALEGPGFATCPDTGNFPEGDWEEGMKVLSPRAFSCHVKVFTYSPDGRQTVTGRDGQTREYDLKKSLAILNAAGYRGPLCVESGASATARESIRDAIDYVRNLMAEV